VRSVLVRGLRQLEFSVLEAGNGQEALLAARRHGETIHVLCTDCVMPGPPLSEWIPALRRSQPEIRVLVVSGYAPEDAGIDTATVDGFLTKPFVVTELASRVHQLTRSPLPATQNEPA
jgi:DNA-binding response OmpR family regulator